MSEPIKAGLEGEATLAVGEADTAIALRSGDVRVVGTPRLVALCEEATVWAVAPSLAPEKTSVGTRVEFEHLAPSFVGAVIQARAILVEVDGHRLRFQVTASEGERIVGRGIVVRAVVDRARFAG
jgi:fluoroacetyl-CoA thioesterase